MDDLKIIKDFTDNQLIFHRSQDLSGNLKDCLDMRNSPQKDLSFGRKIASIPTIVLDQWIKEGVDYRKINKDPEMKKKFYAKLKSREWSAFRTYDGGIGQ